jgi:translation initiation factor 4G
MSRGGSRRGGDRGSTVEHSQSTDGWSTVTPTAPRPQTKAGDLSKFGKIDKTAPMTFGPTSVFNKKEAGKRDSLTLSKAMSNFNVFSLLS